MTSSVDIVEQTSLAGAATSIIFVATKHVFRHDKSMFVATKYFCHDKTFVATNICCDKHFVATKDACLSRQK